jgi:hypothetical protein
MIGHFSGRPWGQLWLRVKVYAGIDPMSGRKHFLTEVIPPGLQAKGAAVRILA